MKRIALFLVTNLAVLVLLSVVARLFGLDVALERQGMDMRSLLVIAAAIGFIGRLHRSAGPPTPRASLQAAAAERQDRHARWRNSRQEYLASGAISISSWSRSE